MTRDEEVHAPPLAASFRTHWAGDESRRFAGRNAASARAMIASVLPVLCAIKLESAWPASLTSLAEPDLPVSLFCCSIGG